MLINHGRQTVYDLSFAPLLKARCKILVFIFYGKYTDANTTSPPEWKSTHRV